MHENFNIFSSSYFGKNGTTSLKEKLIFPFKDTILPPPTVKGFLSLDLPPKQKFPIREFL